MVAGPSFCTIVRHSKCGPNYSRRPPNTVLLEIYLHIMRSKYPERRSQESGGSAIDSRYYSFPKVLRLCLDRETLRDHESDKLLLNTIWGTRMKKDLSAVDGSPPLSSSSTDLCFSSLHYLSIILIFATSSFFF